MNLKEQIERYIPYNEQEENDKQTMLRYMNLFDEGETLKINEDENGGVKWVKLEDVYTESNEKWFIDTIYSKLNSKLKDGCYE